MEIFNPDSRIDFMGKRGHVAIVLVLIIVACLGSIIFRGLALGLDFTGGTLIEVTYAEPADLVMIRKVLAEAGFHGAVVQSYGSARDVMVRIPPVAGAGKVDNAQLSTQVLEVLQKASTSSKVDMRRVEYVGGQVGGELIEKSFMALLFALIGILIYVAVRFEWRFATGAVLATVHDTVFTVGFFSLLGIEFDLTVLAAVLAVIGYSLNDTIVVFDRIRENFRLMRAGSAIEVMNASINQTLSRTIMTSTTTLLVVIALFILGGQVVHGFALALIVGILIGTVSSIYVASPLALWLGVSRATMIPVKRTTSDAEP